MTIFKFTGTNQCKEDFYIIFFKLNKMIRDDTRLEQIMSVTKIHQDFPKKGISFLDVFPIVANPKVLGLVIDIFAQRLESQKIQFDKIFMLQSRGFLFGVPLSQQINKPCYPIRKKGKLPGECYGIAYGLQYGKDQIEIQKSCISKGDKIVLVDDVLATGGTMEASINLIHQAGAQVVQILFLNRVQCLNGIKKLAIAQEKIFYMYNI